MLIKLIVCKNRSYMKISSERTQKWIIDQLCESSIEDSLEFSGWKREAQWEHILKFFHRVIVAGYLQKYSSPRKFVLQKVVIEGNCHIKIPSYTWPILQIEGGGGGGGWKRERAVDSLKRKCLVCHMMLCQLCSLRYYQSDLAVALRRQNTLLYSVIFIIRLWELAEFHTYQAGNVMARLVYIMASRIAWLRRLTMKPNGLPPP